MSILDWFKGGKPIVAKNGDQRYAQASVIRSDNIAALAPQDQRVWTNFFTGAGTATIDSFHFAEPAVPYYYGVWDFPTIVTPAGGTGNMQPTPLVDPTTSASLQSIQKMLTQLANSAYGVTP